MPRAPGHLTSLLALGIALVLLAAHAAFLVTNAGDLSRFHGQEWDDGGPTHLPLERLGLDLPRLVFAVLFLGAALRLATDRERHGVHRGASLAAAMAWTWVVAGAYTPFLDRLVALGRAVGADAPRLQSVLAVNFLLSLAVVGVLGPYVIWRLWGGGEDGRSWAAAAAASFLFDVPYGILVELGWHLTLAGAPDLH